MSQLPFLGSTMQKGWKWMYTGVYRHGRSDSIESHKKFIEKKSLTIELLSSEESDMTEKYGVWQLKKITGKSIWE